jgi:hypothetical protein
MYVYRHEAVEADREDDTQILQEIKHGGKCCIFSVIAD